MDARIHAMEENFAAHLSYLPSRISGMTVRARPELLLVDSGLPSDTFNVVTRARFAVAEMDAHIAAVVAHVQARALPFTWWIGPSCPPGLPARLVAHGFLGADAEQGMVLELSRLAPTAPPPQLQVRRVRDEAALNDFARIAAANWTPADAAVLEFYRRARAALLAPDCPARLYVGYVDGVPVASSEGFVAAGAVGVYSVATLHAERRQGYGLALTTAPLCDARAEGVALATLQASADGAPVYRRLGFAPVATFAEFRL